MSAALLLGLASAYAHLDRAAAGEDDIGTAAVGNADGLWQDDALVAPVAPSEPEVDPASAADDGSTAPIADFGDDGAQAEPPAEPMEPILEPQPPPAEPMEPILEPQPPPAEPMEPILEPQPPPAEPMEPILEPQPPPAEPMEPILEPQSPPAEPMEPILEPQSPPAEPMGSVRAPELDVNAPESGSKPKPAPPKAVVAEPDPETPSRSATAVAQAPPVPAPGPHLSAPAADTGLSAGRERSSSSEDGRPAPAGGDALQPSLTSDELVAGATSGADVPSDLDGLLRLEETAVVASASVVAIAGPRMPTQVSLAIEFGKAGYGWAGAVVFNVWLRRQLRERRMSQRQLAHLSGVDHSTISRLLTGGRAPSLETATRLARALRVPEEDVGRELGFTPERPTLPSQRVEAALRGDDELDEGDVRALMDEYVARRRRHRLRALGTKAAALRSTADSSADPPA